MRFQVPLHMVACLFLTVLSTGGCVTVLTPPPGFKTADAPPESAEQTALRAVSDKLFDVPWPETKERTVADRAARIFLGKSTSDETTPAHTLYCANLAKQAAAIDTLAVTEVSLLLADAAGHLNAADDLAEKTAALTADETPQLRLLERSITQLRTLRTVYTSALSELGAEEAAIQTIREAFLARTERLGMIADTIADSMNRGQSLPTEQPQLAPVPAVSVSALTRGL